MNTQVTWRMKKVTKELNHMCVTDSFVYVKVCGRYETKIGQSTQ